MAKYSAQIKELSTSNKIKILKIVLTWQNCKLLRKKLSWTGRFCPMLDDVLSFKLRKI
jgi:hypothetical protein